MNVLNFQSDGGNSFRAPQTRASNKKKECVSSTSSTSAQTVLPLAEASALMIRWEVKHFVCEVGKNILRH